MAAVIQLSNPERLPFELHEAATGQGLSIYLLSKVKDKRTDEEKILNCGTS